MSAPQIILDLIDRFERNKEAYKSGSYNETQVRREFIDPFFEALGWDVNNISGNAETYKDVIHEDAVKVSGITKAPDYSFRIGGQRKFFVEAKQPSINIKEAPAPAFQVRRYAWSAKLPLSIVTDFDEFAVYDCRIKPDQADRSDKARIKYYTYKQYTEKWDEIASVFSKDAILKGSFDKYAESNKAKRGTAEVDSAFLAEIESWRESLARNIALRNTLSVRELNDSVQRIIDRIIFLRIAEDRGIEDYGALRGICNGNNTYGRLQELFDKADDRYNSGLFHFRPEKGETEPPDRLTPNLIIDDKPLKDILKTLYYPDSPYEFAVLPADILGQVYEQFLGKVIRLTSDHRAVVEDKPEVKKAGGVFYTPTYIVDYIVQNTVGKLLEDKTPKKAESLRILDPACGSGSFLLGAYQYLLDWHLKWYVADGPEKHTKAKRPALYSGQGGAWHLTTAERKRILLNNIYGVDIDSQAVEVTKLSLLLKVLEDETDETLNRQRRLFHERALPDLGGNIKCGNSLIGPDFYDGKQMNLMDTEEAQRVNVFDWQAEFPEIFKAGGFDAVIGNPPYIRMENFKDLKDYLKAKYTSHDERSDLYVYFIELEHKLLNSSGHFGMIVSNKFLRANYGKPLRDFLNKKATVDQVGDFAGLPVFQGATVRTIVLLTSLKKKKECPVFYSPPPLTGKFYAIANRTISVEQAISQTTYEIARDALAITGWSFAKTDASTLLARLHSDCISLEKYCDGQIGYGIKTGLEEAFVIDEKTKDKIIYRDKKTAEIIKPYLNGRDVRRYNITYKKIYLIYTYHGIDIKQYPSVEEYLKPYKDKLQNRATKQKWYELQQPQFNYVPYFDSRKIVFPDIAIMPRFALDEMGYYGATTTFCIPRRDKYLLGILNSRLSYFYFAETCAALEGKTDKYLRFKRQYVENFPIHPISHAAPTNKARHDRMVQLVEQMLTLNKQLSEAKTGHEQTLLQRQIDATDRQIDKLVYELYDLTPEEIAIVEKMR
jgi:type I restriction-modification system DNA methylase subunit